MTEKNNGAKYLERQIIGLCISLAAFSAGFISMTRNLAHVDLVESTISSENCSGVSYETTARSILLKIPVLEEVLKSRMSLETTIADDKEIVSKETISMTQGADSLKGGFAESNAINNGKVVGRVNIKIAGRVFTLDTEEKSFKTVCQEPKDERRF